MQYCRRAWYCWPTVAPSCTDAVVRERCTDGDRGTVGRSVPGGRAARARACYGLCCTGYPPLVLHPTSLRTWYTKCGTDLAYRATRPTSRRVRYTKPGTDLAYGATRIRWGQTVVERFGQRGKAM
eukprot:2696831-Rhodomonas_salina.1